MPTLPLAPSLLSLAPLGLIGLGMASWLDGDEEGESQPDDEEEFGMEDDFEVDDFDDDFGGMDDMEGGEASATELEGRIEELENEIANVSSTANTVRSENEQISEKVDEVQENVRKLLEIYEMVTRGVNPFVDDVGGEMGMGGSDSGGFGLFDDTGEESGESEEDLDEDLAGADAEDFFDDDAFDEFDEDEGMADDFGEDVEDFDMDEEDTGGGDESGGGGTSFEELKEEYESGDADWADDDLETDAENEIEDAADVGFDEEDADGDPMDDEVADDELFQEEDLLAEEAAEESTDETADPAADEAEVEPAAETDDSGTAAGDAMQETETVTESPTEETTDTRSVDTGESIGGFQFGTGTGARSDGPYLESPPNGYLADVVVLEWMDYLLSEFDARNTVRSINYYQRIGWIGQDMRDYLIQVLMGLTDSDYLYRDEFGTTELTMSDHMKSLEYIEELSTGNLDRKIADRLETTTR